MPNHLNNVSLMTIVFPIKNLTGTDRQEISED